MTESSSKATGRWSRAADKITTKADILRVIKESRLKRSRRKKVKNLVIGALKFIFSTGGLLIINFAYLYGGAYLFMHLEQYNEIVSCISQRKDYFTSENVTLALLMDMAQSLSSVGVLTEMKKQDIQNKFTYYMQQYNKAVLDIGYRIGTDCNSIGQVNGTRSKWALTDSFLFAVTISTTIGYGVIAPKTFWGRLVCIAYAIPGIPLFMLALANVGELMAKIFKATYSTVCCFGCCRKKTEKEKTKEQLEKENKLLQNEALFWRIDPSGRPIPPSPEELEKHEDFVENEEEQEAELTVPLTISLLIMIGFILIGGGIFKSVEADWLFLDAVYFSFITFTTIGFGDIVPGTNTNDDRGPIKIVVVVIFILIGMSALSMCLQMLANEFSAKFDYIKEKIMSRKRKQLQDH